MTSARCKQLIVNICNKPGFDSYLQSQFTETLTNEQIGWTLKESNWKRMFKAKHVDGIERIFDCKPFDDQLRATVMTDLDDKKIMFIRIEGE